MSKVIVPSTCLLNSPHQVLVTEPSQHMSLTLPTVGFRGGGMVIAIQSLHEEMVISGPGPDPVLWEAIKN